MKYLKYILSTVLIVAVVSCDSLTDPDLPFDLDGTLSEDATGGFFRIVSMESAALDLGDPENARWEFVGEFADQQNGELSDRIEMFVTYLPVERGDDDENVIPERSEPIKVYSTSDFEIGGSNNRPRGTVSITLQEFLDYFDVLDSDDDLDIGDRFDVRWVLHMNDGRTFTNTDVNDSMSSTPAFRSPFFAQVNVVVSLEEDDFIGDYQLSQQSGGIILGGPLMNNAMEFTTSFSVNEDNPLVGRIFNANPYEQFGHAANRDYPVQFGLFTTLGSNVGTGLGCAGGPGLAFGAASENRGEFDPLDDSGFTMVIAENTLEDCGAPIEEIEFVVTRPTD